MGKYDIGGKIRAFRLAAGLTQAELAKKIGVTPAAIGFYETNKREPNFDTLDAIASALGVSTQRLMTDESKLREHISARAWKQADGDFDAAIRWQEVYDAFGEPIEMTHTDTDRLEALHQNPRLGMLFDRSRRMSESDIDMMILLADRILKERDENDG